MNFKQIIPTLVNTLEKLENQLHQAFQQLGQGSIEYLQRLRDECMLLKLIDQMIGLVERLGDEIQIARISLMKLEHIYYKKDSLYENTKRLLHNKPDKLKEVYFMDK